MDPFPAVGGIVPPEAVAALGGTTGALVTRAPLFGVTVFPLVGVVGALTAPVVAGVLAGAVVLCGACFTIVFGSTADATAAVGFTAGVVVVVGSTAGITADCSTIGATSDGTWVPWIPAFLLLLMKVMLLTASSTLTLAFTALSSNFC